MKTPDFDHRRDGRERRSLFLREWEINVSSELGLRSKWTEVASDFGQIFLKSSFLLNGGALIALPPLMQWLEEAQRQQVFVVSLSFVVGIVLTALATVLAYFNFTFLAAVSDDRASLGALRVNNFYSSDRVELDGSTEFERLKVNERWHGRAVSITQGFAVLVAVAAYIAFCVGVYDFRELVVQQALTAEVSS